MGLPLNGLFSFSGGFYSAAVAAVAAYGCALACEPTGFKTLQYRTLCVLLLLLLRLLHVFLFLLHRHVASTPATAPAPSTCCSCGSNSCSCSSRRSRAVAAHPPPEAPC